MIGLLPDNPEYEFLKYEMTDFLNFALSDKNPMKDSLKDVLHMRFIEGKTLQEIADILDKSRERIRQMEAKGLQWSIKSYMFWVRPPKVRMEELKCE